MTPVDIEQWEIMDDTGTIVAGDRDWVLERWELMQTGRMPVKTLGDVKLIKVVKILKPL
jgi:hypothetical protein